MKYLDVRHVNMQSLKDINGSTPIIKPDTYGSLKPSYTSSGYCVSVNHLESPLKGSTFTLFG